MGVSSAIPAFVIADSNAVKFKTDINLDGNVTTSDFTVKYKRIYKKTPVVKQDE